MRDYYARNTVRILAASVVMLAVIVLYDLRYTHFGMPYDWREIRQAGCIRAAVLDGDTLFEEQIRAFASAKKLDCVVIYCDGNDQMWLELLLFHADVIKPEGNANRYLWTVRENSTELRDTLDLWYDRNVRSISRYDHYFKRYADSIGWDWKMLAAIGYVESRFKNAACPGGIGVMQLSKVVASRFGAGKGKAVIPEYNIMAAAGFIQFLDGKFSDIEDFEERQKFVIAAYNSGMKPVVSARSRARSAGKDCCRWETVKPYYRNGHSKRYQKKILYKYEEYKNKS